MKALQNKDAQLAAYHKDGLPTMLLLDSNHFTSVNRESIAEAFAAAAKRESLLHVDEVFLVESNRKPAWIYPLKMTTRTYPELPEFRELFRGSTLQRDRSLAFR